MAVSSNKFIFTIGTLLVLISIKTLQSTALTTNERNCSHFGNCSVLVGHGGTVAEKSCPNYLDCDKDSSYCTCSTEPEKVCNCKGNFEEVEGEGGIVGCIGKSQIGKTCAISEECVSFRECEEASYCRAERCHCATDYFETPDFQRCLKEVNKIGDKCEDSLQCQRGDPGDLSECANDKCTCLANATAVPNEEKCYKIASHVDDTCKFNEQCSPLEAHCEDQTCKCGANYVASSNNARCLERKGLTDTCVENVQCPEHSICNNTNNVCMCDLDSRYVNSKNNDKCLKLADFIGNSCLKDEDQCLGVINSTCEVPFGKPEGVCKCPSEVEFVNSADNRKCLQILEHFGEECEEDTQCRKLPNSKCIDDGDDTTRKVCGCGEGYVADGSNNGCWEIRREINTQCDVPEQCKEGLGSLSTCNANGVCECTHSLGYYRGYCYQPMKLRELCDRVEECFVGSNNYTLCTAANSPDGKNRCQCRVDAREVDGKCYSTSKRIGEPCETNTDCSVSIPGGRVHCDFATKTCTCTHGYSSDSTGMVCVAGNKAVVNYGNSFISFVLATLFLKLLS